eukprot:m.294419 g.294419  ORF g.294419 m.294419 type:complete len:70 (-) comp20034_c0_seq1:202-411(-)
MKRTSNIPISSIVTTLDLLVVIVTSGEKAWKRRFWLPCMLRHNFLFSHGEFVDAKGNQHTPDGSLERGT